MRKNTFKGWLTERHFCIAKRFAKKTMTSHSRITNSIPFCNALSSLIDPFFSTRAARARGCALAGCSSRLSLFCRMTTFWKLKPLSLLFRLGVLLVWNTRHPLLSAAHITPKRRKYWLLRPNVGAIAFGVFCPHKTLNSCCCALELCMVS